MFRILVTGSRNWADRKAVREALLETYTSDLVTVVHGGAQGLDRIAGEVAAELGLIVESHPADWNTHGKRAGIMRNLAMIERGADVCLAFPLGESRGTRHCMGAAAKAGIPVKNYGDPRTY